MSMAHPLISQLETVIHNLLHMYIKQTLSSEINVPDFQKHWAG